MTGLSVFHEINESFPLNYAGWYNVSNRLVSLRHCMNDSLDAIINFDSSHNTIIRIRDQDWQNDLRQFQFQTFLGTSVSKFDTEGLQVLDTNNN